MPPLPDFADERIFPTFMNLPEAPSPETDPASSSSPSSHPPSDGEPWYLLAQVQDNMTIAKPTLVLKDRVGSPFALVFEGLGRDDLDLKGLGFKKGATAVVRGALRTTPSNETKRPFVRVYKGDVESVRAVPAGLEKVLLLGSSSGGGGGGDGEGRCGGCGEEQGVEGKKLSKCTGCGRVRYCGKECQVKGWETGHKQDCKIYKALNAIFV